MSARTKPVERRRTVHGRTTCGSDGQPGCGAPIVLAMVIPPVLVPGEPRSWVPLNRTFDPQLGLAPTHALEIGSQRCRPLRPGEHPGSDEYPALIHFATCPVRRQTEDPDPGWWT